MALENRTLSVEVFFEGLKENSVSSDAAILERLPEQWVFYFLWNDLSLNKLCHSFGWSKVDHSVLMRLVLISFGEKASRRSEAGGKHQTILLLWLKSSL
jgi:hypothetical protein